MQRSVPTVSTAETSGDMSFLVRPPTAPTEEGVLPASEGVALPASEGEVRTPSEQAISPTRVALGAALALRVSDVGNTMARRWWESTDRASFLSPAETERIEQQIVRVGSYATNSLATYLTTGDPTPPDEADTWKGQGTLPLQGIIPLADLTKLNLHWRTAVVEAIQTEAARLGTDSATVEEAIDVARAGCDASLVGMAKNFDTEQRRLQSEIAASNARLTQQQLHDSLTGLPNRLLLLDRLAHALSVSRRRKTAVAVLFVDIDHFKIVNEVVGHSAGDSLLIEVGRRLQRLVRPSDTASRFGGDEFVLLCEDLAAPQPEAVAVAARVIEALSEPFAVAGRELFASASIGIAIGRPGDDPEALISQADAATYLAKWRGRSCYVLYEPAVDEGSARRAELANALHRTLERGELQVYYQPVRRLRSEGLVTMEALLRWSHPGLGPVAPTEFIPIAEDTGLIVGIGSWVLETACNDCRAWREAGHDVGVSINLSGRQLTNTDLVEDVRAVLERTELPPAVVTFELTESVLITTDEGSRAALAALKEMGVRLAIDDFGTGYSSLSYLADLPVDDLKIDQSFISRLGHDDQSLFMVNAVVELAHSLGLIVIAEGVETEVELAELRRTQCDLAQGFLLGKPHPLASPADLEATPEIYR
jgi:diguanylate cyclase (GGDEF)-like protein